MPKSILIYPRITRYPVGHTKEMDFENFRYRAEPDFLDVRIELQMPSNGGYISRLTRDNESEKKLYAKPINPGLAGDSRIFDIRFQNPQCFADIQNRLHLIEKRLNRDGNVFTVNPTVRCLELALDIYPRTVDDESIAQLPSLVIFLAESIQTPAGDYVSLYDKDNHEMANRRGEAVNHVRNGRVIGIGNPYTGHHFQRVYFKVKDAVYKKKNTYISLPQELWRARFENHYRGPMLIVRTLDDLKNLDFYNFSDNFRFTYRDPSASPTFFEVQQRLQNHFTQVGKKGPRQSRTPAGRPITNMTGRGTKAVADLNRKAQQALRALTRRW